MFDVMHLLTTYGYVGMFIISFLESGIFFLLPGDSILFASGILVSAGKLNLFTTISLFFIGSFLGSLVGYEIGKRLEILEKINFKFNFLNKFFDFLFAEKHIKEAREFFDKKGDMLILFDRYVPIVRTFAPIVAGVARMNYKKFVLYNFIGAAIWSISLVGLGYFLGNSIPGVQKYLELIIIFILIVTTGPILIKIIRKYNKSKKK